MNDLQALEHVIAYGDKDYTEIDGPLELVSRAVFDLRDYQGNAVPVNNFQIWYEPNRWPLFTVWSSMTPRRIAIWTNTMLYLGSNPTITPDYLRGNVWERYCTTVLSGKQKLYQPHYNPGVQFIVYNNNPLNPEYSDFDSEYCQKAVHEFRQKWGF